MTEQIRAHRVTKPIQLLAAWLVGLVAIDGSFLTAANLIENPAWIPGTLVVAAILNVPLFLVSIFVLQTKFRPEMQEDPFYSEYLKDSLNRKTTPLGSEISTLRSETSESNRMILNNVREVHSQIMEVLESLSMMQENLPGPSTFAAMQHRALELENKLDGAVDTALRASISLELNDMLPPYKVIRQELERQGFVVSDTFGSSSSPPTFPKRFVVSVAPGVPPGPFQTILRTCLKHGLQGLSLADQAFGIGRVLVGSYGYERGYAPLSQELIESIMRSEITEDEYLDIIRECERKQE